MFLKREKAFFVSRTISFYDNKYPKKKKHFYYKKKSWVAPFEKNAILCFYNMILLWVGSLVLYLEHAQMLFYGLF